MFIIPSKYYLIISNGMTVFLTREDFKKYELNHFYDFKLIEQSIITHKINPIIKQ